MIALRKEGHTVIAAAPEDSYTEKIIAEGFEFITIKKLSRKGSNPYKDFMLMKEYREIYRQYSIDVVLLYTIKCVIYGNIAKRKMEVISIATITGLGYTFLNKNFTSTIAKKLYRFSLKYCDHLFFQNRDDQGLFEMLSIIPSNKASVVNGSGIDTDQILPSKAVHKEKIDFLFVGRMLLDKGISELLNAFNQLTKKNKNIHLTLVGGMDSDNPSMINEQLFTDLIQSKAITYLGESKNVIEIMKTKDIVILPSYREGIPRVLLEAMSLAKPIIATNVPGCKQVLKHNMNGIMCQPRSSKEIIKAVEQMLLLSFEQRTQMGLEGRKMAEEIFDQKKVSQVYIDLLNTINS